MTYYFKNYKIMPLPHRPDSLFLYRDSHTGWLASNSTGFGHYGIYSQDQLESRRLFGLTWFACSERYLPMLIEDKELETFLKLF